MARFTARHLNKVDRKGRVSVPAPFRAAMEAEDRSRRFYLKPNYVMPDNTVSSIDGLTESFMDTVQQRIDEMDINSQERKDFEMEYFGESEVVEYDTDGRIVLPRELMAAAGITDQVQFVGLGSYFQLWEPEAFKQRQAGVARGNPLPKPGSGRGGGA